MSKFADNMIRKDAWTGLMMGNHALVRAMLESGVMVCSAYPGSPTPEIAAAIEIIPEEQRPIHFEWATNEKVATETAFGASINGHLSVVFFKSVGLNVALDTAVQLSMLDCIGGMVVVIGDDPGANSSQNEQDNRHVGRLMMMPIFEPGSPSETYSMFLEAAELSKKLKMPVLFRMTTHVCHARELIEFGAIPDFDYDWTPRFHAEGLEYWPITTAVFPLKRKAFAKLSAVEKHALSSPSNKVLSPNGSEPENGKRLGVITHSIPAYSVLECMDESGSSIDVLKLGITFPLNPEQIVSFLNEHDEVFILEELDRILEHEIKAIAFDNHVKTKILVRPDIEHLMHEFVPARVWDLLSGFWPDCFAPKPQRAEAAEEVSPRLAQMCPGCGHRSAFFAIRELIDEEFPDAITVADIGCHSLGSMKPYEMGTVLLCMGHSNGTAGGLAIGNDKRKVVCFIGDSTFFHAGLPGIINNVLYDRNVTLVVLENYTTAMTGHQPHAASGEIGDKIKIPEVLEALGVKFLRSVDAYMQDKLKDHIRDSMNHKGFGVVIAKHPCMLKFIRDKRKRAEATKRAESVNR